MHTEEENNKRLLQKIALLENKLITIKGRMQNLQSTILSNISHDIRTPMNAIVGFANLLANENMDGQDRDECIDQINSNSRELLDMIDNMVDASLLQEGDMKLLNKKCFLNDLIDDLHKTHKELSNVKQKNLNLIVSKGEDDDFFLVTDTDRLKQVFKSLIGNAIKFTDTGNIEFGYHKYKTNKIRFFVKDSGVGLETINREDLFKPFHSRLYTENGYMNKGVGLGLSVSKSLINLMGGDIWPESRSGKGTCFYFTLPGNNKSLLEKKIQQIKNIAKRNIASFF